MEQHGEKQIQHRTQIRNYFDLTVWQKARQLVKQIYLVSQVFPHEEIYSLTSQIRRSAISVPSNIAEGYGRGTKKDYVHFLHASRGSLYEMQTQLYLAQDLGYVDNDQMATIIADINSCSQLLGALIRSLSEDNG